VAGSSAADQPSARGQLLPELEAYEHPWLGLCSSTQAPRLAQNLLSPVGPPIGPPYSLPLDIDGSVPYIDPPRLSPRFAGLYLFLIEHLGNRAAP
jgi:hypothetical protein